MIIPEQYRAIKMYVLCNCYKNNKADYNSAIDNYIRLKDNGFYLELPDEIQKDREFKELIETIFNEWKMKSCEHKNQEYAKELIYFGNRFRQECSVAINANANKKNNEIDWRLPQSDFEITLQSEGGDKEFPLIYQLLPINIASPLKGIIDNKYTPDLLKEIEKLENKISWAQSKISEIDTHKTIRLGMAKHNDYFAYYSEYHGLLYHGMLNADGFNITVQKNSIEDNVNKKVVFNSTHFRQRKGYNNHFIYTDCKSGKQFITKLDIAQMKDTENKQTEIEMIATTELYNPQKDITEPLKIIINASIETGNCIVWEPENNIN